jgi:polo-like kinase 1
MSEIRIHRSLHHPNVVGFEHFFEDNENVYILLELCHNQTLSELLKRRKRLSEIEVQCYVCQIISGLKYLHSRHVIHRDLKLGNLFLTDKMEEKIGDFGLATKLEYENDRRKTVCGTPNYIAPEIISGKEGHSYEVDIWSLGVIIYTLLIGKPPFETSDVKTTYRRIKMNAYSFPDHIRISSVARDLITKILNLDPKKRPTLDQILEHSFLHMGVSVPKLLPLSTLSCPPPSSFIKQFNSNNVSSEKIRLETTAPIKLAESVSKLNEKLLVEDKRVWIKKWIDYTSRYGLGNSLTITLGYMLTNDSTSVFFNDSTKITLDIDQQ